MEEKSDERLSDVSSIGTGSFDGMQELDELT